MPSDLESLNIGNRVRIDISGRVSTIGDSVPNKRGQWLVIFAGGLGDWFFASHITLTLDPLTPAPVVAPVPRPLWEVKTAYEYELDASLADGWEPFAATFVEQTDGRYNTWKSHCYHLRRLVKVPDVK